MTHTRSTRPVLSGRISRFLPALAVLAFGWSAVPSEASPEALAALTAKLQEFANQKYAPATPNPRPPTITTATADDLVYAVYQIALTNPTIALPDLVATALQPTANRVRADKDKVAARLLSAAVLGSGSNDSGTVSDIVDALGAANSTGTVAQRLTAAGKAAVVGQALKLVDPTDPNAGVELGTSARTLAGGAAATDAVLQAFTINALRPVTTNSDVVKSFTDNVLDEVNGDKRAFVTNVAISLAATNPNGAGAVFAGRAAELADGPNGDSEITSLVASALANARLAKAQSAIVAGGASEVVGDKATFASSLIPTNVRLATTAVRANIASGVLRSLTSLQTDQVDEVIAASLTGKTLTVAETATFAGAAAVGTGDLAGDVAFVLSQNSAATTAVSKYNIGRAVLRAVATSSPTSGDEVATRLIESSNGPSGLFNSDQAISTLAVELAKAVPTNGVLTGSAVAGAAGQLTDQSQGVLVTLAANTMRYAPKASLNIAKELAAFGTITSYTGFASSLAQASAANSPAIAAGIAVTAVSNNSPAGQSAGDIAVAASTPTAALQAKLLTTASAVAVAVDVERVADVGSKVSAVMTPTQPAGNRLPKLASIGALATSLTKAINTKPLVTTANRKDEIGELAAELTRSVVKNLGTNATPAQIAASLNTMGTGIMAGLSAALLQNGGTFAADRKDAAGDIAGAIAQTLSVMALEANSGLDAADLTALLSPTGTLAAGLKRAATTQSAQVTDAFTRVNDLRTGATISDRLVQAGNGQVNEALANGYTGIFEIGSVIDPSETPVTSLP